MPVNSTAEKLLKCSCTFCYSIVRCDVLF